MHSYPYPSWSFDEITESVEVRHVHGKGRCLFSRKSFAPGDIIYTEHPMLISDPALNPELFARLTQIVDQLPTAPELPQVWHYAALLSLLRLDADTLARMASKWVPDGGTLVDCERILAKLDAPHDLELYAKLVQVWRYNSFGHHTNTDSLCMYDITSCMAHSCTASAVWHFAETDAFCLRARTSLLPGDEVCISYLGDEELFRSSPARQEKTAGWLFTCACDRCVGPDYSRGFRCPACCVGAIFSPGANCSVCNSKISEQIVTEQLRLETLYVDRVLAIDKQDQEDVQLVLSEALNLFAEQHWVIYYLKSCLCDSSLIHLTERIAFQTQTFPLINYATAWLVEELGDLLANKAANREAAKQYERSYWMLRVLCGPDHPFTEGIQTKWEAVSI